MTVVSRHWCSVDVTKFAIFSAQGEDEGVLTKDKPNWDVLHKFTAASLVWSIGMRDHPR
jgi:hypothetical protein